MAAVILGNPASRESSVTGSVVVPGSISRVLASQPSSNRTGSINIPNPIPIGSGLRSSTNVERYIQADVDITLDGSSLTNSVNGLKVTNSDFLERTVAFDANFSSGRIYGGEITEGTVPGTIDIADGYGVIKSVSAGLEDIPQSFYQGQSSAFTIIGWSNRVGVSLAGVGYNIIFWDASAGEFAVTLKENLYSVFDFTRDFTIGRIYYDGTSVTIRLCGMNIWNFDRRVQMFGEERFPVERATGLMIGNASPPSKQFTITSGVIWAELVNRFTIDAYNTGDNFIYWYRDGSGGWTSVLNQTEIDDDAYDNGTGTLATVTSAPPRYGVHWVFMVHDSSVHVVYGRGNYTLSQAQNATVPTDLPGIVGAYATIVGKIILAGDGSTFYSIESPFVVQFQTGGVTNHNELSSIQGGTTDEYYHLTSNEADAVSTLTDREYPLTTEPSSNSTLTGIVCDFEADASLSFGDVVHIKSDGLVSKADADSISTAPAMGLIKNVWEDNGQYYCYVLLHGIARLDSWNWTPGGILYLSNTAGEMTQTAPSGASNIVQVLGIATHADRIYFKPSLDTLELTAR